MSSRGVGVGVAKTFLFPHKKHTKTQNNTATPVLPMAVAAALLSLALLVSGSPARHLLRGGNEPGGDMIDVRHDFGCKGDGRTDDTQCLQAAIYAGGRERRRVHVPGGTYVVTRALLIYGSNQTMMQVSSLDMFNDGRSVTTIVAAPGQWGQPGSVTDNLGVLEYLPRTTNMPIYP